MKILLALTTLLALADAELDQARAELKKALAELGSPTLATAAARLATAVGSAADRLAASDQKAGTDALFDGYGKCAVGIKGLWGEKVKHLQEREANGDFKIDLKTNPPTIPQSEFPKYQRYLEADKNSKATEAKIGVYEACKRHIVRALAKSKSDAAVKVLVHEVTAGAEWQRRAAAAEAMGQMSHKDVPPALLEALKKDNEHVVRIAVLDALRELKLNTPEVVAAVVAQLQSEYWQLKVCAALALQAIGSLAAVEPLIDALSKSDGRLRIELNDALAGLTGVNRHGDPAAWKAWFEENREAISKGTYAKKVSDSAGAPGKNNATTTFYGIPVDSKSVIFVLDRSGSMVEPSDWDDSKEAVLSGGGAGGGPEIKKGGDRKIDIARWQLKKAIAQLPEGTEFNVIFFSHEVVNLSEKMLRYSATTRKQAFDWIDKLDPFGGTNTFDALERALNYASGGMSGEKLQKSGVDTVCLVTDGLPNAGQVSTPAEIVERIRTLNKNRKVKIHTVGIFTISGGDVGAKERDEGLKFLKQLAEDSGGKFTGSGVKNEPAKPDPKKPDDKKPDDKKTDGN
jgi:hypothetical protein